MVNKKFEELSPLERAIIGIEKRRWKYQGSKEKTIGALGHHTYCLLSEAQHDD